MDSNLRPEDTKATLDKRARFWAHARRTRDWVTNILFAAIIVVNIWRLITDVGAWVGPTVSIAAIVLLFFVNRFANRLEKRLEADDERRTADTAAPESRA
jgi:uncharacterized membrane protein